MDEKILYIIIAIIWIVSSILKATNKKKQTNKQQEPQPEVAEDDFKSVLEEMILGKRPEMPVPVEITDEDEYDEIAEINESNKQAYANYEGSTSYDFNKLEKLEDVLKADYLVKPLSVINTDETEINENQDPVYFDGEDFDARKAVIYAEILKRPHF